VRLSLPAVARVASAWLAEPDVLARASRLRATREFQATIKNGVRVGGANVVMHVRPGAAVNSRAGFTVSKAVGDAVTRNRVKRQLRHAIAPELGSAPAPVDVVARALPSAGKGVTQTEVRALMARAYEQLAKASRS